MFAAAGAGPFIFILSQEAILPFSPMSGGVLDLSALNWTLDLTGTTYVEVHDPATATYLHSARLDGPMSFTFVPTTTAF